MSSLFSVENDNVISFDFYYRPRSINEFGEKVIDIFESKIEKPPSYFFKGHIYIRYPTWAIMNDISRSSSKVNSYTGKSEIDPYQYRDYKLKRLLLKIEDHEGEVIFVNDEFVDSMNPVLATFILNKIDQILDSQHNENSLSKEEAKELALDVFNYLKRKKERESGHRTTIPPMPSIMLVMNLCDRFHVMPDEARRISTRDLEMMSIVEEQTDVVSNPDKYGYGDPDRWVKFKQ